MKKSRPTKVSGRLFPRGREKAFPRGNAGGGQKNSRGNAGNSVNFAAFPVKIFTRKVKIVLVLLAMVVSASCGAFLALKIAAGPDFSDALVGRKIQEEVSEKISRIRATQGDILELAVLESSLTFELQDEWSSVPAGLGRSVSRVSVPAVFRFFVKISEPISVSADEDESGNVRCTIVAPRLQPVLPVAFDTSRCVWTRDIGAFRFNREEMTDALQEKISMRLVLSAKNHARTAVVRDAARQAFEKFVRRWLQEIRELDRIPEKNIVVKILFEDEVPPPQDARADAPSSVPVSI